MIRTKAKSILLSVMLLLACFCFFACKEETEISVDSISFSETSITLLVGEEYTPQVKIVPSYANARSYTLVSGDTTALTVDGGTITAVKAMRGVKLKVVSDSNPNANDMISVDIYDEASDLESPTELKFDGNKFTFVGKDNANAYMLKINGNEINIGNNTEYSFNNVVAKLGNLYNDVVTCSVKAVGDGKIFNDSDYSHEISFVKISSVENLYIENETLYFNAINDVASFNVEVSLGDKLIYAGQVNNALFNNEQLSLNISELTDSVNGAEYIIKVTPNLENYNNTIDVFGGETAYVNYSVVGSVKNVVINDRVISWGFVNNAQTYTVDIHKDGNLLETFTNITNNYLQISYDEAGEYYCEVLANSNKSNTTSGKIKSNPLYFDILPAPQIIADNNTISWQNVEYAEGYLVTIKNNEGATLINKSFVLNNFYDISAFKAGTYSIEIISCGNGENGQLNKAILSSKLSQKQTWTILNNVQFKIENEKLYWKDEDVSSLNKYRLKFDTVDVVLTDDDFSEQYKYDETSNQYSYDLSSYDFEPNTYEITIQSVGENNIFDATINNLSIIKLAEGSIANLQNKQFVINPVNSAINYKIEVYALDNTDTPILELDNIVNSNKFNLDDSLLQAGNYVAKVFAYGNGTYILDADNLDDGTTILFEKLATPTITVDADGVKLIIDKDDIIKNENKYTLRENGTQKNIESNEYSLANVTEGDYVYTAKAVGNNSTILDSDWTITENEVKVKRLATPTMSFDKNNLTYTISCTDNDYVENYTFLLNEENVSVVNNVADCSALMGTAQEYYAQLCANAPDVVAGYDLVLDSAIRQNIVGGHNKVIKLDGLCDFQISNGKLIVTPSVALSGGGYSLSLRIDNGENDIILNNFTYTSSRFEKTLHDNKYNVVAEIQALMTTGGQYNVYTTISQNSLNVITSNEAQCENTLNVLGRVVDINKNAQTIEFNLVDSAVNYKSVITLNGTEHYIDIKDKYSAGVKNVLTMNDLLQLMQTKGVSYLEKTTYNIKFVALSEDVRTIPNKGVASYEFEFLSTPNISITEQNGNTKYLAIENSDVNATNYNVIISQGEYKQDDIISKHNDVNTIINMDEITSLVAGNVNIEVKSMATTGNYFESKYATLIVNKLNPSTITIVNGLLQWDQVPNAKQYNLAYSNTTSSGIIALSEGSENFTISGGKCIYNFDTLESGLSSISLQVDSQVGTSGVYYLNSDSGVKFNDVYKLPALEIGVVNGQLHTEIRTADLTCIGKIEMLIDGKPLNIDISQETDDIKLETNVNKMSITINPNVILKYGSTELLKENILLKLYSNNNTTLNSSASEKDVYGLLSPTNLDITTSLQTDENNVIDEVFEKITWDNPTANGEHVSKYKIAINYNESENDYIFYSNSRAFMMPTYFDQNENGVLDEGEVEFGAGVYTIKVQALTDNCDNILNSKYCGEIEVTVLATPTNLSTKEGNVIWSNDASVEYYLIKVYLLDAGEKQLIASSQSNISEFDLCTLNPLETGVYGVSVQAMHNNSRVLASDESNILQVIRLPQVSTYYVKNGEFYFRAHSFYTKAEIYLTSKETSTLALVYRFTMNNTSLDKFDEFVGDEGFVDWASSNVLDTYNNQDYFMDVKYQYEGDSTFRSMFAEGCTVSIKLFGNTSTSGAIISGHTNNGVVNDYLDKETELEEKNSVEKLVTPTVKVSETQRGVALIKIPSGINYTLKYYRYEDLALQGIHLYQVNVLTDKIHTIVVADIVDEELLLQSLEEAGGELVVDASKNNIKYINYLGLTFNVVDKNAEGYIELDFNTDYYYYHTLEGDYTSIDLTSGGSFVVQARFLGDDTQFVLSSGSDMVTIKRYRVLNLTVNNGVMSWLNQATAEDEPIYLITINNNQETYNLVLYNPNTYTQEQLMNCLDAGKTYIFDTINYSLNDSRIIYKNLANIIDTTRKANGSEQVGLGGTFLATVKAHYTDASSMDIVLAQGAETKTVSILPKSTISVVDGKLTWDMAYVTNSGGKDYIANYLLQVYDESGNQLYQTILGSADYIVSNYVATYELEPTLNNGIDGEFSFVSDSNYIFKLVAVGGDSNTYINSVSTETQSIRLLPQLQDLRMEKGILTWTNPTSNNVEVQIIYAFGGTLITLVIEESSNQFNLPAAVTDVNQTLRELIAGYNYIIMARIKGDSTSISGFVGSGLLVERMATVATNSIHTSAGVLTWEANALEGTQYTVVYTLEDGTTGTTKMLNSNSYDFGGLAYGVISAQIYTHHFSHFSSFVSESVELYKLATPTNIVYEEGSTTISWDKVVDKNGEYVETYRVKIMQEGHDPIEYICSSNEWAITGVTSTAFSISVKAISVDESGTTINSDYTEPQSMSLPNQVDATTFKFDSELQAFKWKAIEGEQVGDKYYIGYNYYETDSLEDPSPVEPIEINKTQTIEGEKYYYYYPTMIGNYRLIYVQVVRAGSLSSQQTFCVNDDGSYYYLDFDLFTSGHGTSAKPYIISNERHLRNIKYFLSSSYELDTNITLTSNDPITDSTQVFTGVINGNSYYINGVSDVSIQTFSSSGYVGLFNRAQNATFNSIALSNFAINGYVNSASVYIGILVGYAESTTFTNITLTSSTINIVKSTSIGYGANNVNVYAGAIVGYALNTQLKGCIVNLGGNDANVTISIQGNSQTKVSFGGFVGYADECALSNNTNSENAFIISITLTISGGSPIVNVGALVGEAGAGGVVSTNNTCTYFESVLGELEQKTNEIGKQN